MSIIPFLILASLALAVCALGGFIWAVRTGQFEDTCTPSMRILMEDAGNDEVRELKSAAKPKSD